ncbi:MAG: T9SS type A sorting domain-containing protein, partial [Bacteroidales bacterium]|nr:T9SS type A sorting domain-containing protein [Bacteroidales bacterium]
FDLDILIFHSQGNTGNRSSRPEAWAKNVVAVGGFKHNNTASRSDDKWNRGGSIGPCNDGRVKPDLSNFFDGTYAAKENTSTYMEFGGTSGATPITAGYGGMLMQMWADGVFDGRPGKNRDVFNSRPHMTTARALLINSAYQYKFSGTNHDMTRTHQGWGTPDLRNLYDMAKANGWSLPILVNESRVLKPLETHSYKVNCDGKSQLKVTMVYADPEANPSAKIHRVNDITLKVTSPSGTVYWGNYGLNKGNWSVSGGTADHINVVENVFIENAEKGVWKVEVLGDEIVADSHKETSKMDADYALVATTVKSNVVVNPPVAPTNLSITVKSCKEISLKWKDVASNETSYQVVRRIKGSTKESQLSLGANVESFVDKSVSENTVYQYKVNAVNSAGVATTGWVTAQSTPSCSSEVITVTDVVTNCYFFYRTQNTIYFNVNASHTKVQSNRGSISSNGTNKYKLRETGVPFGSTTTYEITPMNGNTPLSTKSVDVTAVTSCWKSTDQMNESIVDIHVYPVPASGEFTIRLTGFEKANVSIFSMDGRLVHSHSEVNDQILIDAHDWNDNMYIIKVSDNNNVRTHKLILE